MGVRIGSLVLRTYGIELTAFAHDLAPLELIG